ncbi:hypothetical protein Pmar_PMAR000268 [Perkinsus marinus ATCC 50983]|uniref:Uncharacterized protein n=1 Tax=Perkinsus marinus (strain ATCC 50983 / TXsc) TaxID=423536 RepID=C5LNZ6_PERM5|nr:hypothetical protein Pmar_PMAR000268 [Perkinsus marinus ATCC 50983]EER01578.1 hypothetical protein Pmar_PMAR000268 [Perkinsus marinus ATCC 50983]|eukprot:XP_002768860.1 hypothetical protein Pmar_PMAR000268 [Perkinsus marinus ATCC 50983]
MLSEMDTGTDPLYTEISFVAAKPLKCTAMIDTGAARVYIRQSLTKSLEKAGAVAGSRQVNRRILLADGHEVSAIKEITFYIELPKGRHVCLSALEIPTLTCGASSHDQPAKGNQDQVNHIVQEPSDAENEDNSIDDEDSDEGPIFLCSLQPSFE